MILVVGVTGKLGRAAARLLRQRGVAVRGMSRRALEADDELHRAGVEVVPGDLCDPASVQRAVRGCDVVIAAAHSLLGRGRTAMDRVDGAGHRTLIDASRAAGVRHFVYVSVHGASPDHPLDFLRTKAAVETHLEASGLTYTILRPTAFIETHAHELIGRPILERGKAALLGRGRTRRNFVSAADVARFAVRALDDPALANRTLEVGGWDNLTDVEVAELYMRQSGQHAKIRHAPPAVVRVLATSLRPVHPGISRVMQWALLNDRAGDTLCFDPAPLVAEFGIEPVRLETWVRNEIGRR